MSEVFSNIRIWLLIELALVEQRQCEELEEEDDWEWEDFDELSDDNGDCQCQDSELLYCVTPITFSDTVKKNWNWK